LKYPPTTTKQKQFVRQQKPDQQPPNIVGIEDFPDMTQVTTQLHLDPIPKHLLARPKPHNEPELDKLGSPSTYHPIRPKSKPVERTTKEDKRQEEEQLKKEKEITEAAIQAQRLSTLSRQPPPPLYPPQPRRPPPPKLPATFSNRQLARMRPEPTKSYHHISANFGTWWHASLPRTTKDQPIGKSMAMQAPDWNSKLLIVPPPGTVIPKPDSKIFDKHSMEQAQERQQQDLRSTNQHMVKLAAEEAQREPEANIAAQQQPPKLTKNQQRAQ